MFELLKDLILFGKFLRNMLTKMLCKIRRNLLLFSLQLIKDRGFKAQFEHVK